MIEGGRGAGADIKELVRAALEDRELLVEVVPVFEELVGVQLRGAPSLVFLSFSITLEHRVE